MRNSPENERVVLSALPGSTGRAKLDGLVSHATEFVGLYGEVMSRVAKGEGSDGGEEEDGEDGAGAGVGTVRDGAGEGVAREIVSYLEGLRDG